MMNILRTENPKNGPIWCETHLIEMYMDSHVKNRDRQQSTNLKRLNRFQLIRVFDNECRCRTLFFETIPFPVDLWLSLSFCLSWQWKWKQKFEYAMPDVPNIKNLIGVVDLATRYSRETTE